MEPLDAVLAGVRRDLADAVLRLRSGGARDEALGEYVEPGRVLGFRREPTMRDLGRVWRLGALLLAVDGSLLATGAITRVADPGRPQFQSTSAEIRRAYRAAAARGRFPVGETVNHGAVPVAVDGSLVDGVGPLFVHDARALVRWSPTAGDDAAVPLGGYLDDRIELLVHPPAGA